MRRDLRLKKILRDKGYKLAKMGMTRSKGCVSYQKTLENGIYLYQYYGNLVIHCNGFISKDEVISILKENDMYDNFDSIYE